MSTSKVVALEDLCAIAAGARKRGEVVVHSHGAYDILHPGHIRHLRWAAEQGDMLIVSVVSDETGAERNARVNIPESDRAEHLASLMMVDYVVIDPFQQPGELLTVLKPDVYVKGREFEAVEAGPFSSEREVVESYGGKVLYSSGAVGYSSFEVVRKPTRPGQDDQIRGFYKRHGIDFETISARLAAFREMRMLVVGEAIVDEYVYSQPIGMSADSPTVVVRPDHATTFLGGAGIVAQHVSALGATCEFITVLGADQPAQFSSEVLERAGISAELVVDSTRPTIHKKRYIADGKKLLNVNVFSDQNIDAKTEAAVCSAIRASSAKLDGIIISDFNYGVVTAKVIETIIEVGRERGVPVIGDSQSSSQLGRVTRLAGVSVATPSEREARLALIDQDSGIADLGVSMMRALRSPGLLVTLGARGLMILDGEGQPLPPEDAKSVHDLKSSGAVVIEYMPSFATRVVDSMGAGDAMLSGLSIALASGGNIFQGAFIGNCASAIAVSNMGNVPVSSDQLLGVVRELLAPASMRRRRNDD